MKQRPLIPAVQSGGALIAALFFVIVTAAMSAALVSTSLLRQESARALHERERAMERALAGLDVALFEMNSGIDTGTDGIGTVSTAIDGGLAEVSISPAFSGNQLYTLTVTGRFGPAAVAIEVIVDRDNRFEHGLIGRESISMSGSFSVDSYSGEAGSYASQFVVDHAGDSGHLASDGDITAGGGVVYGDATPGPTSQVYSPENVIGSTAPAAESLAIAPYVYAPTIASSGSWTGTGSLSAGVYRYTQLTLSGGSNLTINGDVTLYVDDKFTASGGSNVLVTPGSSLVVHHGANDFTVSGGGIVNQDEVPEQVSLYSASLKKVTLSGGSSFYGLLYAPEAEFVSSGGSQLYGVIVSRKANLSGDGRLHFDTSLGGNPGAVRFQIRAARTVRVP